MNHSRHRKYNNHRIETSDGWFDSKSEWKRWVFLKDAQRDGKISDLERQVEFPIDVDGKHICKYIADYCYFNKAGLYVVEDFKGVVTDLFKLKAKLVEAKYEVKIHVVKVVTADLG